MAKQPKRTRPKRERPRTRAGKTAQVSRARARQAPDDRWQTKLIANIEAPSPTKMTMSLPPRARTVIYVHGIGNKPIASVLKCQWDQALFGVDMGERTRMAYWVNRQFYPTPSPGQCGGPDFTDADGNADAARILSTMGAERDNVEAEIQGLTPEESERNTLRKLAARIVQRQDGVARAAVAEELKKTEAGFAALDVTAKIIPIPGLRQWLTRLLTRAFLRDVNEFFYDAQRRDVMRQSLLDRINSGGGPFVVIGHSQGSMIAYDVLRTLDKARADVALFVTIGCPLGLDEVQDVLKGKDFANTKDLPFPRCVDRWVNVADQLDPVAGDSDLSDEFPAWEAIENFRGFGLNPDSPRHPHSGTGYLSTPQVRTPVRAAVGNAFSQPVSDFVIARDLARDLEDSSPANRHEVLIQLVQPQTGMQLSALGDELERGIKRIAGENVQIQRLQRFIAASLTRNQVEQLRDEYKGLNIENVWRDAKKAKLIYQSTHTIQARPANRGYGATGEKIHWAVLDTGVWAGHPHFKQYDNIETQWDCTQAGDPKAWRGSNDDRLDGDGHGTHVAGIIAGSLALPRGGTGNDSTDLLEMEGMAPQAKLHIYKVLDDNGSGRDSWIIKALDHVAATNERAGELVIHGMNLSLGGAFDAEVYGCGHSPLCQELRRLWQQGVVVCLAAGNEGRAVLSAGGGDVELNLDLSISDPANLEESIGVGSVHRTNPHTYGISYFSSRGPTADGRVKPDVVAPGERILSACHRATRQDKTASELYVEMSGTSMATPHVSGVIAAFLSRRREYIGYPDRLKEVLLANCTDLRRDPYFQGKGLVNLIKMLANT